MASMKLGSKADTFSRQDQAWFCTTGLPSDVTVEVENIFFHLHKFPLISRSGLLERMIKEALDEDEDEDEEGCVIRLDDIPGGAKSFETVAKFCYGMKLELTATTVICLRCAAEQLLMTEEYGEGNLITQTENFLEQVVFRSWKESIKALQTCDDFLPHAENLQIVQRCIESLSVKASTDPNLFSWPMEHGPMQSPGGSILWNGISTGARLRNYASGWWYDDVSCLGLPVYKRLISCLEFQSTRQEIIAGSVACYAKKYLPGLNKRKFISETSINAVSTSSTVILSEDKQKHLLEEILNLLPMKKGLASTKLLFSLLRTAMILRANHSCMSNLEKRIGMQLDQATLEDLLLPSFSYSMETLYNIDSVKIILEHFLAMEKDAGNLIEDEQVVDSPSIMPIITVARLIDGFLAEVASDVYLKLPKFQALASAIPSYARHLDDGIYRAIDIYMKAHPWLTDSEREQLCRLMDCQKLSLEACTHAAQNERLPLRVVVQVLFFEQLQLRSAIASSYLISDNLEVGSRPLKNDLLGSEDGDRSIIAARESRVLKVGMDNMRTRVIELEKECSNMKKEIEKLGKEKNRKKKDPEKFQKDKNTIREIEKLSKGKSRWGSISGKFGFNIKPQMCSAQKESVSDTKSVLSGKIEKLQTKLSKEDI